MLEAAGAHERFIDGREIVPVLIESGANGVEIAERRKELQRARQQAFALKQLAAALWRGSRGGRSHTDGVTTAPASISSSAHAPRVNHCSLCRVARVAIGTRGESQQAAVIVVALPGQQRRVFSQQLLQAFDVVVVNDASSLRCRPLQTVAEAFAHFSGEVLPAGVAVLTRDHELRVALRQGQVDMWQVHSRTCDGTGVTGGDVARELLCLFAEGVERRTSRERLRSGHCDLLS